MRNIRRNLFFAFVHDTLGVPIATGPRYPFPGLVLCRIAAMHPNSVSVIGNPLTPRREKL